MASESMCFCSLPLENAMSYIYVFCVIFFRATSQSGWGTSERLEPKRYYQHDATDINDTYNVLSLYISKLPEGGSQILSPSGDYVLGFDFTLILSDCWFYLYPITNWDYDHDTWYNPKRRIGINEIGLFMRKIAAQAGIPKPKIGKIVNHSNRRGGLTRMSRVCHYCYSVIFLSLTLNRMNGRGS